MLYKPEDDHKAVEMSKASGWQNPLSTSNRIVHLYVQSNIFMLTVSTVAGMIKFSSSESRAV